MTSLKPGDSVLIPAWVDRVEEDVVSVVIKDRRSLGVIKFREGNIVNDNDNKGGSKMSENLNGGPAFPRTGIGNAGTSYDVPAQDGMTLLDYFAAGAMQGMLADSEVEVPDIGKFAEVCYKYAQAMLAERQKRIGGTT